MSTRKDAAAPGWKARSVLQDSRDTTTRPQPRPKVPGRESAQPGKRARSEASDGGSQVADAKAEAKRRRLAYARDYGALQVCANRLHADTPRHRVRLY